MNTSIKCFLLLGICCFLFSSLNGQSRRVNFSYGKKDKYNGSVQIDYLLVAKGVKGKNLKNLEPPFVIDLEKYPDAYLRIQISKLRLAQENHFERFAVILNSNSVTQNARGYRLKKKILQIRLQKEDVKHINYEQTSSIKNMDLENFLRLTIFIQSSNGKTDDINSSSGQYSFKLPRKKKKKPERKDIKSDTIKKKEPSMADTEPVFITNNDLPVAERHEVTVPIDKPGPAIKLVERVPAKKSTAALKEKDTLISAFYKRKGANQVDIYFAGHHGKRPEMKYSSGLNFVNEEVWNKDTLSLKIEQEAKVDMLFTGLEANNICSLGIELGIEQLVGKLLFENNILSVSGVKGGRPDYLVVFEQGGTVIKSIPFKEESILINCLDLAQRSDLKTGIYRVKLIDSRRVEVAATLEVIIPPSTGSPYMSWLIPGLIGFGLVLIAVLLYRNFRKDQKPDDEFVKNIQTLQNSGAPNRQTKTSVAVGDHPREKKQITIKATKKPSYGRVMAEAMESVALQSLPFLTDVEDYFTFSLSDIWKDSNVKEVYMHKRFAARLNNFVFDENDLLHIKEKDIPEIGGFLLGKAFMDDLSGQYQLSLERFVGITPEDNGVYQIAFGMTAWQQLDTQLEAYQDEGFELLGWFHTHPGHGLFLSRPDLSIHDSFFKKPFQVAMELDSMKRENNLGFKFTFFSRKQSGVVNNSKAEERNCFHWDDISSWLKTV